MVFMTVGAELRTPARGRKHPGARDLGEAVTVTSPEGAKQRKCHLNPERREKARASDTS